MKTSFKYEGKESNSFSGESIKELVENNFKEIAKFLTLGNHAGYELKKVWTETENDMAYLHIIACGVDSLIGFDPSQNEPKEYKILMPGIKPEDLPEKYEFDIKEEKGFNPFEDYAIDEAAAIGALTCTVDFLCEKYTNLDPRAYPSRAVKTAYPCLLRIDPELFISQVMKNFAYAYIIETKGNKKYFDLIEKINDMLARNAIDMKKETKIDDSELVELYYHKSRYYFRRIDKTTALKLYRKEACKTQREVADETGISLRQYQRYEATDSNLHFSQKSRYKSNCGSSQCKIFRYS